MVRGQRGLCRGGRAPVLPQLHHAHCVPGSSHRPSSETVLQAHFTDEKLRAGLSKADELARAPLSWGSRGTHSQGAGCRWELSPAEGWKLWLGPQPGPYSEMGLLVTMIGGPS